MLLQYHKARRSWIPRFDNPAPGSVNAHSLMSPRLGWLGFLTLAKTDSKTLTYVAQTILSIQRDAVCSLAKRGLVSNKEKEVLLEEVLEDLEEVFKLEEDRGHEQHGGEHGGVEHWVDAAHTLPSQDVEAHLSARPADAARMTLANSRLFGANGAYASARARVGDTRRILGLRNSGEEAEWCGAHMATTRRRMDRISTIAPPASYESASTRASVETVDETN